MKFSSIISWPLFGLLALALLYFGYQSGLNSPFYFDDLHTIKENSKILNSASLWEFLQTLSWQRAIPDISFYLNLQFSGADATQYRVVNLTIHLVNSLLVSWFIMRLTKRNGIVSFSVALIFLMHPIQVQSVTYIVQRYNEIAALFMLLALVTTTKTIASSKAGSKWLYATLTVALSLLALMSKENAAVLFFLIPLVAYSIQPKAKLTILPFKPSWLTLLFVALISFVLVITLGSLLSPAFDQLTRASNELSRIDYLLVQGPVILNYLGKLFYPSPLFFDYAWTVNSFTTFELVGAWLVHFAIIAFAVFLFRKTDTKIIGFGVLFYYLALIVESSILPIDDIGFEHRNYLPLIGLALAVTYTLKQILGKTIYMAVFAVILGAMTLATFERNSVWSNQEAFIKHELNVNPKNPWIMGQLAKEYVDQERFQDALRIQQEILDITDGHVDEAFLFNFWYALMFTGNMPTADQVKATLATKYQNLHPRNKYRFHVYSAMLWRAKRQEEKAVEECMKARKYYRNLFENICSY